MDNGRDAGFESLSGLGGVIDSLSDRVRYSGFNPRALARYNNTAPEYEFVTCGGFDFGQLHNLVDEEFRGLNYVEYQRPIQKGMDRWDENMGRPEGFDREEYVALLRTMRVAEEHLRSVGGTQDWNPYVAVELANIESGHRFVERDVNVLNRVDDSYDSLLEDAMVQAEQDLEAEFGVQAGNFL